MSHLDQIKPLTLRRFAAMCFAAGLVAFVGLLMYPKWAIEYDEVQFEPRRELADAPKDFLLLYRSPHLYREVSRRPGIEKERAFLFGKGPRFYPANNLFDGIRNIESNKYVSVSDMFLEIGSVVLLTSVLVTTATMLATGDRLAVLSKNVGANGTA